MRDADFETPSFPPGDFRWRLVATGFWCRLRDAAQRRDEAARRERNLTTTPERAGGSNDDDSSK